MEVLELGFMLDCAELVTAGALAREESRGGHFRDDFPDKDETFGKVNTIVRKGRDGRMNVSRAAIPEMSGELKAVIEAMK